VLKLSNAYVTDLAASVPLPKGSKITHAEYMYYQVVLCAAIGCTRCTYCHRPKDILYLRG